MRDFKRPDPAGARCGRAILRGGLSARQPGRPARGALVSPLRLPKLDAGEPQYPHARDSGGDSEHECRALMTAIPLAARIVSPHHGRSVDRAQPAGVSSSTGGATGFAGDTLASALLAAGVKLVGRSFKYHRPRGIVAAGSEEPNALVELRSGRAGRQIRARPSRSSSTGLWPQPESLAVLGFDLGAVNSLLSPIFVAGFYYKTFMWPAAFWEKLYEPADSAGGGPGACQPRARSGHLRQGARILRRAGHRRRSGGPRGGTRGRPGGRKSHPLRRGFRAGRTAERRPRTSSTT